MVRMGSKITGPVPWPMSKRIFMPARCMLFMLFGEVNTESCRRKPTQRVLALVPPQDCGMIACMCTHRHMSAPGRGVSMSENRTTPSGLNARQGCNVISTCNIKERIFDPAVTRPASHPSHSMSVADFYSDKIYLTLTVEPSWPIFPSTQSSVTITKTHWCTTAPVQEGS